MPYIFIFWLADKIGEAWRISTAADNFSRVFDAINGFSKLGEKPFISFHPFDIMVGAAGIVLIKLVLYLRSIDAKKYRKGVEYGKTAKSILISCGARLAPFDIAEVRNLMSDDELEIDRIEHEKTALFAVVSDDG